MSTSQWRAQVSRRCIGAGLCLSIAPQRFRLDGLRAEAVDELLRDEDELARVRAAAGACPAAAIAVVEVGAGDVR